MFGPRGAGASRASGDLHNEDRFLVADEFGLYVVCDGRGSAPGGEIAAYLAVEAIKQYLEGILREGEAANEGESIVAMSGAPGISDQTIEAAVEYALECILDAVEDRPELAGMGTTLTLLLVQRGRAFIGHSGDSRAHLIRSGRLLQLTTDREWTTDGVASSASFTRGIQSFSRPTQQGDTFVLCTDGAEAEVSNSDFLETAAENSPRLLASRLVAAANRHDSRVDATVVVVRIHEDFDFAWALEGEFQSDGEQLRTHARSSRGRPSQSPAAFDHLFDRTEIESRKDRRRAVK